MIRLKILVQVSTAVLKEDTFEGTYLRDIYSGVNRKWYKRSQKDFDQLKNIDQKYYCSSYYDVSVNKYGVKCGTSLRFWENKEWINEIDPYRWFQWYFRYWLGRSSSDDERQINRWKGIGQILLHWGYEQSEEEKDKIRKYQRKRY